MVILPAKFTLIVLIQYIPENRAIRLFDLRDPLLQFLIGRLSALYHEQGSIAQRRDLRRVNNGADWRCVDQYHVKFRDQRIQQCFEPGRVKQHIGIDDVPSRQDEVRILYIRYADNTAQMAPSGKIACQPVVFRAIRCFDDDAVSTL